MRKATMVCGDFPDIRAGRTARAMRLCGWEHDVVTRGYPPQFEDAYTHIDWDIYRTDFHLDGDTELYHVHAELHHGYPVLHLKESTDKPVIMNIHDLGVSRSGSALDKWEAEALDAADAHVWVTAEQRAYAASVGFNVNKPYVIMPNYASSEAFIDKTPLPHIGGICYEGFVTQRGDSGNDRDFSRIADALDDELHIYGGSGVDTGYGIDHPTLVHYEMLLHRLAQHDWGLAGYDQAVEGWLHSTPTKAFDYLAAGIPIISWNTPLLQPVLEAGMGVEVKQYSDLKKVLALDPKPYKKAVMRGRQFFTTERIIDPLGDLYDELTGGSA